MPYVNVYVASNGRRAKEGKSNSNGKPRRIAKMDNNREEAEMGRYLVDGTTPYSVLVKICV